jgi:hypothetical protein
MIKSSLISPSERMRHRRIAISLVAGTLNSAAPFSIAAASSGASTTPARRPRGDLVDAPPDRLGRRFGLLGHARRIGRELETLNSAP